MSEPTSLSHNNPTGPCAVCDEVGRPCARCRLDYYCCKEHQRQHWSKHRHGCGSVELRGRHVVAVRDIPAETIILRETPLLGFPDTPKPNGPLFERLCLGCYAVLGHRKVQCRQCGLPVCGEACSKMPSHQPECAAFQRAKFKVSRAQTDKLSILLMLAVGALRTALVAQSEPRLRNLESTLEFDADGLMVLPDARSVAVAHREMTRNAVKWLLQTVRISWLTEDELIRAASVNLLHGEIVRDETPARFGRVDNIKRYWGFLFVGCALLQHDCMPNTASLPIGGQGDDSEYVTVTTRPIAAGERITRLFQNCEWASDTRFRRTLLLSRWGFVCKCNRCMDPTEMGMYVGSPCCPECAEGGKQSYVIPNCQDLMDWKCETCDKEMTVSDIDALVETASTELERLQDKDATPKEYLDYIRKQEYPNGPLHATHSFILKALEDLRYDIYIRKAESDPNVSQDELVSWSEVCWRLVRGLDRLLPGVNEGRINVFLELRRLLMTRLYYAQGEDPMGAMMQMMAQALFRGTFPGMAAGRKSKDTGEVASLKKEILGVNKEVLRHIFKRDDQEPKASLIKFPYK